MILAAVLLLNGCASLTPTEKLTAGLAVVAIVADRVTTQRGFERGLGDLNPIVSEETLIISMAIPLAGAWLLWRCLPSHKNTINLAVAIPYTVSAIRNERIE